MTPLSEPEPYKKITQVSILLQTPIPTIRQWAKTGKLPYYKPGKHLLFRQSDIEDFMAQHRWRSDAELNTALEAKKQELYGRGHRS
jgi:excisionase family DNA binding protein